MTDTPAILLVKRMIEGWEARDAAAVSACFAVDGIWLNVSYPPIRGRSVIEAAVARFLAGSRDVRFVIRHLGEIAPGIVMSERNDIFTLNDGRVVDIPVMGVFEVADGLIIAWRDYFDPAAMPA